MITPLLLLKERLVEAREKTRDELTRIRLGWAILDLELAIEGLTEQERAHREEIEALMGRV